MRHIFITLVAVVLIISACTKDMLTSTGRDTIGGEAGSMAAMTIVGNYMYRIAEGTHLEVYDLSKDSTAVLVDVIRNLGPGLETIFPYKKNLLIGTQFGMMIFGISNPAAPIYMSTYSHVFSCDPVVAQGDYAYVTLRTGNRCNRGLTQLEVIDISNLNNPQLVKVVDMELPHGLDADGDNLVVGEGPFGFKWFDISNPTEPQLKYSETAVHGFDIISQGKRFILIGDDGLYQYEYTGSKPTLLSKLETQ